MPIKAEADANLLTSRKSVRENNIKIELLKVEELIPYTNNPRINDSAVDMVASSINEFGFKVPIVVDKNNIIIAGHTRLKAAIKLGLKEVPCLVASDLTPAQIKAFRIADNKTNEFAEWDWTILDIELAELKDMDFDIDWLEFGDNVNIDDFFINENSQSKQKDNKIICPECGAEFEI